MTRPRDVTTLLLATAIVAASCSRPSPAPSNPAVAAASRCPDADVPPANFETLAVAQAAANAKQGVRHVPARDIPTPTEDVTPAVQSMIGEPYGKVDTHQRTPAEWKADVAKDAESTAK